MKWVIGTIGLLILVAVLLVGGVIGAGFFLSPQDDLEKADAIVAVSGGETRQRVEEAVNLFEEGWASLLIMSGAAQDDQVSNAAVMKQIAISLGVPADKIVIEEAATNTLDNAKLVRDIIEKEKLTKIILVTSPYHQRRAGLSFIKALKGLPVEIINHSSTDSVWRKNGWWQDDWSRYLTLSELQKIIYTWALPVQSFQ
ncbi:MAG: YdcF family protein [Patescibacteria group bacterium]